MATGRVGGLRSLLQKLFPERQFYHRSHGEVRFISLSARNQIGLVAVTFSFLMWVAYASVNVVFKEQIITSNERRLTAMQADYEVRLSEIQSAYDELNSLLMVAQEQFDSATRDLQTKHGQLESFVVRHAEIGTSMSSLRQRLSKNALKGAGQQQASTVLMQAVPLEPTPRVSRTGDAAEETRVTGLTNVMRAVSSGRLPYHRETNKLTDKVEKIDTRIAELNRGRQEQLVELEEIATAAVEQYEAFLGTTGLDIDDVLSRFEPPESSLGGPLISMDQYEGGENGSFGDEYQKQIFRLEHKMERLEALESALTTVPLAMPVEFSLRRSSGYGPRRDPFTRRTAFHSGLDFAGPSKSSVYATSGGKVVYAKRKGPYGNLVEIDHGHGFRTRYGHLYKIKVKVGDTVDFGQVVGLLGSSGRSTGPHLHYEVWFKGKVRDPRNFLKAGRYVFKN